MSLRRSAQLRSERTLRGGLRFSVAPERVAEHPREREAGQHLLATQYLNAASLTSKRLVEAASLGEAFRYTMDLVESKQRIVPLENRHPWELARLEAIKRIIREFVQLNPGANILDVGCGDSFLISQVAKEYPDANFFAVDTALTPELVEAHAKAWPAKNLATFQDLESAGRSLGDSKVSLILLLDVIEHIEEDVEFLRHLQTFPFVTDNTTIIITVPSFQALFCSHDKFLGHHRRYTNRMLNERIAKAGLHPMKTAYFFSSLLPSRFLQLLKEKCLKFMPKLTSGLAEWKGNKALASVLKRVLMFDFRVNWRLNRIGINIWGLSNITVCKTAQPKVEAGKSPVAKLHLRKEKL